MHATISVLPGDGIGPEVTAEGRRVLDAVAARWNHTWTIQEKLLGGCAIEATGTARKFCNPSEIEGHYARAK